MELENHALLARTRHALDEIRPYLKSDGGDVELIGIDQGIATVRLTGHCAGCPMSTQTLKAGIEKHLCAKVPELVSVVQEGRPAIQTEIAAALKSAAPAHSHTATAALREEHARTRRTLSQLESALQNLTASSPAGWQNEIKTIRLAHAYLATTFVEHMNLEDEILFPRLLPFVNWGRPTVVLEYEHRNLRTEIEAMNQAIQNVETAGPSTLVSIAGQLCRKIRDHLFREENTVFFEADAVLDADTVSLLGQQNRKSCAVSI